MKIERSITMKRICSIVIICIFALTIKAQNTPMFIFDQFYPAKIHFKNHSVTAAPMNYDAVNDKMYFKQGKDLMELTNAALIDSISWSGKRCFIPNEQGYLEKINLTNGTAYIHWHIKNVNVGSKGAMGAVTQAKVETINIRSMGIMSAQEGPSSHNADVFEQKNANEYYLSLDGKLKKITNKKHVLKLFPKHHEAINEFMDKENIKMNEPLSVLELLNFCLGLK